VGLAAGAEKAEATRALARSGVLDVLVIDAPLARALLDITSQG
jgi:DNA-binding transcriptional regulator LsrR (DeoR family)